MMWLLAVVVVLILGAAWIIGSGRWGAMPDVVDDRPSTLPPPDVALEAADLRATRFSVVPRGYSMEQVDALIERIARQLEAGTPPVGGPATARAGTPVSDAPTRGEGPATD